MSGSEALDEAREFLLAEFSRAGYNTRVAAARVDAYTSAVIDDLFAQFAVERTSWQAGALDQAATIQSMREALEAVRREAGRALVRTPSGPEALALGNIRHVADAALAAGEHQEGRE